MAGRHVPQHALELSTQDFLSLLDSSPQEGEESITMPAQEESPTPRPRSAGGILRRSQAHHCAQPTIFPTHLPQSISVTFVTDPVSETRVFGNETPLRSGRSRVNTPESSPFSPEAFYKSPEDARGERPSFLSPPSALRSASSNTRVETTQRDDGQIGSWLESSPSHCTSATPSASAAPRLPELSPSPSHEQIQILEADRTSSEPPLLSTKTKQPLFSPREMTREPSQCPEAQLCRQTGANSQPLIRIDASPPSQTDISQLNTLHNHDRVLIIPTNLTAATTMAVSAAASGRKSGLFHRVKNAAAKKVQRAPNSNIPNQSIVNHQPTTKVLDFEALFYEIEGRITYDREIKGIFEENEGLKRVWKEAIPLFQEGKRDEFEACIESLETAMMALSGKSVVFD